jgi:hypothetical protein
LSLAILSFFEIDIFIFIFIELELIETDAEDVSEMASRRDVAEEKKAREIISDLQVQVEELRFLTLFHYLINIDVILYYSFLLSSSII